MKEDRFTKYSFQEFAVSEFPNPSLLEPESGGFQSIRDHRVLGCNPGVTGMDRRDGTSANDEKGQEETLKERAYAQGFSEGEKLGMETGIKKVQPVLNDFQQACLELERVKKQIYANAEKETVELALAIARKIVQREVSMSKEVVVGIVKEALRKVVDHEKLKIKVNPQDFPYLEDIQGEVLKTVDTLEGVCFEQDDRILNGGCIIETRMGDIDARIDSQLAAIEEAFRSEFQKVHTS